MFERRARAYRSAQKDPDLINFDLVEKAVALRKAHRNAGDFDSGFIRAACRTTEDAPMEILPTISEDAVLGSTPPAAMSEGDEGHDPIANEQQAAAADAADRAAAEVGASGDSADATDDVTTYVATS